MRKGYKRRKGLIALASAFVLVALLSIPILAVDSSAVVSSSGTSVREVSVNGIFILESGSVLADYFEVGTSYAVESGSFAVYGSGNTLVLDGLTTFKVTTSSGGYTFTCYSGNPTTQESTQVFASDDATYTSAEFDVYSSRYIVFNDVHLLTNSAIFEMIMNCRASTSSVIITSADVYANGIVDVIVGGFNGIITGLGSGVADFFQTLFLANDGTGNLSTFAIVALVSIGVAVAFGIARWIIKKVGQ